MNHIKMTEHFLAVAREMPSADQRWLAQALCSGRLLATGNRHCDGKPGRLALSTGQGYLVMGCDLVHDPSLLALLTWLSAARSECLRARADTRIVPLAEAQNARLGA